MKSVPSLAQKAAQKKWSQRSPEDQKAALQRRQKARNGNSK